MPLIFGQQSISKKPLVSYFTRERASIQSPGPSAAAVAAAANEESMPKRKRSGRTTRKRRGVGGKTRRRRVKASNKVRVVGGRVRIRVTGYQGLQSLAPSSLIRFIPATKLRLAAKKVLRSSGVKPARRRRKRLTGGKQKRKR